MRFISIILVVYIINFYSVSPSFAGEIDDLREEIAAMKRDYGAKIEKLEDQIRSLAEKQDLKVEKLEEKIDKSAVTMEYVGRYNGPFEKGGVIIKNPSGFGSVSVGGYADIEYENFENSTSTFDQHRWIINIGAELFDRLRFYSEYEIEHGGPNISGGGGEAKVEQAWIEYGINDWINVRAGALLVPFGRYNLYHDSDLQDLQERPLVARRVIPTTWTEAGAGIAGLFDPLFDKYEELTLGYEFYVINGLNAGFDDSGLRGARGGLSSDNNNNKAIVGRTVISPALGHEVGGSFYYGEFANGGDYMTGAAIDWFSSWEVPLDITGLNIGPMELVGEYAYFSMDEPSDTNISEYATGVRIQANLHFWPEFFDDTFLGRNFEDPTFTLVGRYGWIRIDDDSDATTGFNEEQRWTIGLNYRPVDSWVFKVEYLWNDTKNEPLERGSNDGFMASVAMGF